MNIKGNKQLVLLFHLTEQEKYGAAVHEVLGAMGITARDIEPQRQNWTLGALAGIGGFTPETQPCDAPENTQLMVLRGLNEKQTNRLLGRLTQAGVPTDVYKAAMTETNKRWRAVRLMQEVQKERQALEQGQSAHQTLKLP